MDGLFLYLSGEMVKETCINLGDITIKREQLVKDLYSSKAMLEMGNEEDDGSDSAPEEGCYRDEELLKMLKINKNAMLNRHTNSNSKRKSLDFRPSTTFKRSIVHSPDF